MADPLPAPLESVYTDASRNLFATASEYAATAPTADAADDLALFTDALKAPQDFRAFAPFLFGAGLQYGVPPVILYGIMIRESRGNPDQVSDDGNDFGLMQISSVFHPDFTSALAPDGTPLWKDPKSNIDQGASILAWNYGYFRSTKPEPYIKGLQDPRPLSGMALLTAAVAAYNASYKKVLKQIAQGLNPDFVTTGLNYAASVIALAQAKTRLLTGGETGSADPSSLALLLQGPPASGPLATVYQAAYADLQAGKRGPALAATSRADHYAEAAHAKTRLGAAAADDLQRVKTAASVLPLPQPAFVRDANLAQFTYDFSTGLWGDGEKT